MPDELKRELFDHVDASIKQNISELAGPVLAEKVAEMVKAARSADVVEGRESLSAEAKNLLVEDIKRIAAGEKAAYLTVNDQTGGYLVPVEVHNEILRIAAVTGIVARDARRFGISDVEIPIYTGAVMQGSYVGEDSAGTESQEDLGVAKLVSAEWMNIVRLSNKLIKKANVNVAEWLMAIVAEGLSYKLDREGFVGGTYAGSPFVGILGSDDVSVQTMLSGKDAFDDFDLEEASIAIGALPEAALGDAAFYFNRTVWARIRIKKSGDNYVFGQSNLASLKKDGNGLQAVGEILGFPVYTTDVLPTFSSSAASTKFGVFGNLKMGLGIGEDGPMSVLRSENAVVNGVSTFERNQTAMRFTHNHAVTILLPDASVVLKTAAN
ncbi:phage major capsid protein [Gammaproteobacteria bacterium LSUCC0112]|nr:phage major capsid protein [Gammaproteobacteria bacterium LSUCC0112]